MSSNMHIYLVEMFGTALLILMGDGTCANIMLKKSGFFGSGTLTAALGWAAAMTTTAVIIGPITSAPCNPAFLLGFWLTGRIPTEMLLGYFIAEVIGAFIGAALVWLLFKNHLDLEEDQGVKLGVFATGPSINNPSLNVLSEAVATFTLMILVLCLGNSKPVNGISFIYVDIALAGGVMAFGGLTGYAINPVRDLMPRIVHAIFPIKNKGTSNWSYSWVPIVGPTAGAALAAFLYIGLFK